MLVGSQPRQTGRATNAGRVVGRQRWSGVELWQNLRDRFWFLENLIRNQDDRYRGTGREVVSMAIAWLGEVIRVSGRRYGLRVHAMAKVGAVAWWTHYLGRDPDFDTAYMKVGDLVFPAFGWILVRTPRQQRAAPSPRRRSRRRLRSASL